MVINSSCHLVVSEQLTVTCKKCCFGI